MCFRSLLLIGLALPASLFGDDSVESFFGLSVKGDSPIESSRIEEFLPARFLEIDTSMREVGAERILEEVRKDHIARLPPEHIPPETYEIPHPYFFNGIDIYHDREDRLEAIELFGGDLPIRRASVLRLHDLLRDALGPAAEIHTRGKQRSENPGEIYVRWIQDNGQVLLRLDRDDDEFAPGDCRLLFYPAGSARLERRLRSLSPPYEIEGSTRTWLADRLQNWRCFLDGDGPIPPKDVGDTLADRLEQYGHTTFLGGNLSFRTNLRIADLHRRLEPILQEEYSAYPVPERYERILETMRGRGEVRGSGAVQVGAAAFLAHYDDPATLPFLREGQKVGLPSGVSMHCAAALARHCTGDALLELLERLKEEDPLAVQIAPHLSTRQQLEELQAIFDATEDPKFKVKIDACMMFVRRNLEEGTTDRDQ